MLSRFHLIPERYRQTDGFAINKNSIRHMENRFSPYFIFLKVLMQFML